jgi:hypothetical protein
MKVSVLGVLSGSNREFIPFFVNPAAPWRVAAQFAILARGAPC